MLHAVIRLLFARNGRRKLTQILELQHLGRQLDLLPVLLTGPEYFDRLDVLVWQMATSQMRNDTRSFGAVDFDTSLVRSNLQRRDFDDAPGMLETEYRQPVVYIGCRRRGVMVRQEWRDASGLTEQGHHHVDDMPGHLEEHTAL